jgi:hypothetical protein
MSGLMPVSWMHAIYIWMRSVLFWCFMDKCIVAEKCVKRCFMDEKCRLIDEMCRLKTLNCLLGLVGKAKAVSSRLTWTVWVNNFNSQREFPAIPRRKLPDLMIISTNKNDDDTVLWIKMSFHG